MRSAQAFATFRRVLRFAGFRRVLLLAGVSSVAGAGIASPESASPVAPAPPAVTAVAAAPKLDARSNHSPLSEIERHLSELEREEQGVRRRFDALGGAAEAAGSRVLLRGRAYVRLARAGLLPAGDGFAALVEHATKLERFRRALSKDWLEQRHLVAERARLSERLSELGRRIAPLRADHQALVRAETALLAVEDRQRAFERAFNSSTAGDHTAVYGAVGPSDPRDIAAGFSALKGKLPFPLTGRSEIKSSRRSSSDGPGLEMRAPLGTAVRAVYNGRVAFADGYADYGKTVIVDHGDRHYTVSSNLASIDVRVGDEITTGARLGSVGDSGRGALLYFEVRVGTVTVDPAEWFGL